MSASLDADLTVRRGAFVLEVALRLAPGEVLTLLGPNGSGKSTLLGALAGVVPLESGCLRVAGRLLSRAGDGGALQVPPAHRNIGLLGQDPLLFPHLDALANVAFGPRSTRIPRREAAEDAHRRLSAVGLGGFERHKPAQLSGGQQQRVAIARALAARPDVLLLDEPMAALDVQTAPLVRSLLRDSLASTGTTAIIVTHDVVDALSFGDRVAVLQKGRIVDDGPVAQTLGLPSNPFTAAVAGVNFLLGRSERDGVLATDAGWRLTAALPLPSGRVAALFPPAALRLWAERPQAPNVLAAEVATLEPAVGGIRVRFAGAPGLLAECTPGEAARLALAPGARIWLSLAPEDVSVRCLP